MVKNYAVVFMNLETGKVKMDTFSEASAAKAGSAFRTCYRHGNYKILSVTEIPEWEGAKKNE